MGQEYVVNCDIAKARTMITARMPIIVAFEFQSPRRPPARLPKKPKKPMPNSTHGTYCSGTPLTVVSSGTR